MSWYPCSSLWGVNVVLRKGGVSISPPISEYDDRTYLRVFGVGQSECGPQSICSYYILVTSPFIGDRHDKMTYFAYRRRLCWGRFFVAIQVPRLPLTIACLRPHHFWGNKSRAIAPCEAVVATQPWNPTPDLSVPIEPVQEELCPVSRRRTTAPPSAIAGSR